MTLQIVDNHKLWRDYDAMFLSLDITRITLLRRDNHPDKIYMHLSDDQARQFHGKYIDYQKSLVLETTATAGEGLNGLKAMNVPDEMIEVIDV